MHHRTRTAIGIGISALLFSATAEIAVRALNPVPRIQVFANSKAWDVDGYPIYRVEMEHVDRRQLACPKVGTTDVIVAGDSVFTNIHEPGLGSLEDEADLVAPQLHRALQAVRPEWCVLDVSEPGFGPMQQWIAARQLHERIGADYLVVGVWKPHLAISYIGSAWYLTGDIETGSDGTPRPGTWPVPEGLHRTLFELSAAYRLLTLDLVRQIPGTDASKISAWVDIARWAQDEGIPAIFVELPSMEHSFEETLRYREDADLDDALAWRRALEPAVVELGVTYRVAAEWLRHLDHEEIRLDSCCHMQRAGHVVLAEHLAEELLALEQAEHTEVP